MKIHGFNQVNLNMSLIISLISLFSAMSISIQGAEIEKTTVSVYGFKSIGIPQALAESLQEHLESNVLHYAHLGVLSRNDMEIILMESKFQYSGICSEEECLAQAGHIVGVKKIITGTVSRIGSIYNVVLKLIDVNTAELQASVNRKHSGYVDGLLDVVEISLRELLGNDSRRGISVIRDSTAQAEPVATKSMTDGSLRHGYDGKKAVDEKHEVVSTEHISENQQSVLSGSDTTNTFESKEPEAGSKSVQAGNNVPVNNTKKARLIGIGAVVLLTAMSACILVAQLSSNLSE
jgi:TolB-like protein